VGRGDLAAELVRENSMLQFCVVDGCTTVVMGRGTCLEHDGGPTLPQDLLDRAARAAKALDHLKPSPPE
jgi:hypothetical protein